MDGELLRSLWTAFKSRNVKRLKKVNDSFLNAFIKERKPELFELAVVSYVLFKILTKPRFFREENKEYISNIEKALASMSESNIKEVLGKVEAEVVKMESRDPRYIFDLFTKSRVKMAATLYAKGISLGLVSKISGIPKQEILSYAGKTMMFERVKEEIPVMERYKAFKKFAES